MKPWIIGLSSVAVLGGALALALSGNTDTLPQKVMVGGVEIGGLTQEAALDKVKAAFKVPQITVKVVDPTPAPADPATPTDSAAAVPAPQVWTLSADKLGYKNDAEQVVTQAFSDAQNLDLLSRLKNLVGQGEAMSYPVKVSVDQTAAQKTLTELTKPLSIQPKDGEVGFSKTKYVVTKPSVLGQKADVDAAVKAYAADPKQTTLNIGLTKWEAQHSTAKLQAQADQANKLLRPLTVQLGDTGRTGVLTPLQVADLFWLRQHGIEMDKKTIQGKIKNFAGYLDAPARDARYKRQGGGLVRVKEEAGFVTDQAAAYDILTKAVLDPSAKLVKFPGKVSQPTLTVALLPDPSKMTLIAEGYSTYYHSSPQRRMNIANAAAKIDGAVVPPNGTFSFLNTLGSISPENGFVGGLIISGGRTVDGLGGGVCQVSTTTFRALYNAGLPIVERNQHSYRVGYYEPQVGFEAAVYDPGVDLKMKNDTGGTLLVRTINNNARSRLLIQVWGTKPQTRKVAVSGATILRRIPHPAPLFVTNRHLPRGAVKQVDYAADGYSLFITRTIRDGGKVVSTDRVDTRYKPWQAVYEVNR